MRKGTYVCLLLVCCLLGFCMSAFAGQQKVFDNANLLTEQEKQELQTAAETVIQKCGIDLAFLTTEDTEGLSVREYGAKFYREQELGIGAEDSGILFVVDMTTREAQIVTSGKAISIFTEYYIDKIWNDIQVDFADGDYFWGMKTLANRVLYYCAEYQTYQTNPQYVSEYEAQRQEVEQSAIPFFLGSAAAFSLVVAAVAVFCMKKSARTVHPYTTGTAYLKQNGVTFFVNRDIFATTHTHMVPLPKQEDSDIGGGSWGGGSDTFQSGGGTFGGGGGRF